MITISLNEKIQKEIERIQKGLGSGRIEAIPNAAAMPTADKTEP